MTNIELSVSLTINATPSHKTDEGLKSRVDWKDVKRRYPKEKSVLSELIMSYIMKCKELGKDHTETEKAREIVSEGLKTAHTRSFPFDRFNEDFEDVLAETRVNWEGSKLGDEPSPIADIREDIMSEALIIWDIPQQNSS